MAKFQKPFKTDQKVTPKGVLVFPWLTKADTKFNAEGVYKTSFALEGDEAEEFAEMLDGVLAEAEKYYTEELTPRAKAQARVASPYEEELDDDGEPTGRVLFRFKQNATIKRKDGSVTKVKLPVVDSKRKPTSEPVYGGTVAKLAYYIRGYFMQSNKTIGLTLHPLAVQVIEKPGAAGGNAASLFGEEEGYEAEEKPVNPVDSFESEGDAGDPGYDDSDDF